MEVKNCPRCGKIFTVIRSPFCPACEKLDEEVFQRVKSYLEDNPNQSLVEVAAACDTSTKKILGYVRDGRLLASEGLQGELVCAACGKPIQHGRYCDKCVIKINQEIENTFAVRPAVRMHTDEMKR